MDTVAPAQPGYTQPLPQRLYQAIRTRPADPPHRGSRQQRDRLRSERQIGRDLAQHYCW
jgi:hypothetical protein